MIQQIFLVSRLSGSVTYSTSASREVSRVAAVDVETACCAHGVVLLSEYYCCRVPKRVCKLSVVRSLPELE